ncbi:MAG: hypothetical protein AAGG44_20725, partial [Planctomycetota bacterium]
MKSLLATLALFVISRCVLADTVAEFQFRTRPRPDNETKTIIEGIQFGRVLVSHETGAFVYQLWPEGKPEHIHVAAGFDGQQYWYALNGSNFSEHSRETAKPNRKAQPNVWQTNDASAESRETFQQTLVVLSPTFFASTPGTPSAEKVRDRLSLFDS